MSLKFAIFRGEFDGLLTWPFPWKIILWIYDQVNKKPNIIDHFDPDPTSANFSRPVFEQNPSSEIRRFCPISILRHHDNVYAHDDTIFFGIMLDMVELPQQMLPDTLCFDLALPESCREARKQKLIEECHQLESKNKANVERQEREMKEKGLLIEIVSNLPNKNDEL